ncbi:hypothetical protein GCM10028820_18970 [Tessaracoccus terricola]
MSAPGWYPDPRGGGGRRYWDGVRWTDQVQGPGQYPHQQSNSPQQYQHPQYGQPQYAQQGQSPADGGNAGGSTVALWITLAVSVALIIGLGSWLLFFRDAAPETTTSPTPTVTEASTPAADPTTPEPDPTTAAPDPTTPEPEPTTAAPETTAADPTDEPATTVVAGDALQPMQCEGTATDARGEANPDGRFESALGLSFPGVEGFTAQAIQYPWVWGSNSQFKDYGNSWMATLTVGNLKAADGFLDHEQAAVRLAQCMLSSQFYGEHFLQATVFAIDSQPDNSVTWLDVDVDVTGVEGVGRDWVTILTAERAGEIHVGIAVVPDSSEEDYELVQEAFADLRFS